MEWEYCEQYIASVSLTRESHWWQCQHPNTLTATIYVQHFATDLEPQSCWLLVLFLCALFICFVLQHTWGVLINHQILIIGLTLRVNISISDWQRVIYTITSKIDWYGVFLFFSRPNDFGATGNIKFSLGWASCFIAYFQCQLAVPLGK